MTFEFEQPEGVQGTFLITYVPELNQLKEVTGIIAFATDITQLKQAKIIAEQANTKKSIFLANMAHEIRTPLGAVLGFSELLLRDDLTAQDRKMYRDAISRNGSLLSNIINDVLDLSKIEAGMLQLNIQKVVLQDIINDVHSTLLLPSTKKDIDLILCVQPDTPKIVYTDPLRIKQMLLNVVGNAVKFTEKGHVKIHVGPLDDSSGIKFVIEDSGIGISAEQTALLFQPFNQSKDACRRGFSGTGLGLALSRHMAQMLGGDVQLTRSEVGKGSIFTITFASYESSNEIAETIDPYIYQSRSKDDFRSPLSAISILLVEDSFDNQILIAHILQNAGARVKVAQNGVEAVDQCATQFFDIILMDLQMPLLDGYHAAVQLRDKGNHTPIIALSAHTMGEVEKRCAEAGIDAYLSKPINEKKLISTLTALLQSSSSRSQHGLLH